MLTDFRKAIFQIQQQNAVVLGRELRLQQRNEPDVALDQTSAPDRSQTIVEGNPTCAKTRF